LIRHIFSTNAAQVSAFRTQTSRDFEHTSDASAQQKHAQETPESHTSGSFVIHAEIGHVVRERAQLRKQNILLTR